MRSHIVLNALALHADGSGVQTYCRELLRTLPLELDADLTAVVQHRAEGELPTGMKRRVRHDCDGLRRTIESLRSPGPADLVHALDVDLPLRPGAPSVATVHDLSLFDEPAAFGADASGRQAGHDPALDRRADAVIAVSAFTAERVRARFGRESHVVHEAPAPGFSPPSIDAVTADTRAIRASRAVRAARRQPRAPQGCAHSGARQQPQAFRSCSPEATSSPSTRRPARRVLGQVAPADLPALYGAATVVAYVPRYEGFGLPPIEAMACGATVMATRCGALPEVAGDAIEFVPIGDADAQAGALRDLVNDPARRNERVARVSRPPPRSPGRRRRAYGRRVPIVDSAR